MTNPLVIELYDNTDDESIPLDLMERYQRLLTQCVVEILTLPKGPDHILSKLETVELSIVEDSVIADIHAKFLNDPSPTDVITFPHGDGLGEIVVSRDTAQRQAKSFDEPWERELFRYMVHGLLHLHGYLDALPDQRAEMFAYQEPLVLKYWV
ncbi:MAG: rRNA maturation RNase YbeY [Akkermansia sp.]